LDRRLKTAQAIKAERPEKEDIPTSWEAFYKENVGKKSAEEMIEGFSKLKAAEKSPAYEMITQQNPETQEWEKGWVTKGSDEFVRIGPATAGDIKKAEGEDKGSYYRVTDDEGNVSTYKGDKLLSGSGKGKTSKNKEKLYKTERGFVTAEEAKGLKPWEKSDSGKITPAEERQRDKDALKVEEDISKGKATMGDIGFFNKYHKGPYVYVMKKGEKKYGMFGWDYLARDIPDSLEKVDFNKPEDVRNAYKDKTINRDKATQLLLDNFEGFEE